MPTIEELANTLTNARAEYYAGRDSGLTDDEYDALERKLKKLNPGHPLLKTVGAPAENTLRKVKQAAAEVEIEFTTTSKDESHQTGIGRTNILCHDHTHTSPEVL